MSFLENIFKNPKKAIKDTVTAGVAFGAVVGGTSDAKAAGMETEGILKAKAQQELKQEITALPRLKQLEALAGDSISIPLNGGMTLNKTPEGYTLSSTIDGDQVIYTCNASGIVTHFKRVGSRSADWDLVKDKDFTQVGSTYYQAGQQVQIDFEKDLQTMLDVEMKKQAKFFAAN